MLLVIHRTYEIRRGASTLPLLGTYLLRFARRFLGIMRETHCWRWRVRRKLTWHFVDRTKSCRKQLAFKHLPGRVNLSQFSLVMLKWLKAVRHYRKQRSCGGDELGHGSRMKSCDNTYNSFQANKIILKQFV